MIPSKLTLPHFQEWRFSTESLQERLVPAVHRREARQPNARRQPRVGAVCLGRRLWAYRIKLGEGGPGEGANSYPLPLTTRI